MATETLERAFAMTRGLLANVTPDDYDSPTPCPSWSVRDLVNHIAEGANWFALCVNVERLPTPTRPTASTTPRATSWPPMTRA